MRFHLIFHFSWISYKFFYDYFNLGGLFHQFFFHFSIIWQSLEIKKTKCMTLSFTIVYFRSLYSKIPVKYAAIFCCKRKKSHCKRWSVRPFIHLSIRPSVCPSVTPVWKLVIKIDLEYHHDADNNISDDDTDKNYDADNNNADDHPWKQHCGRIE